MSNFICDRCGFVNIDCGQHGYKTPREIELEKQNVSLLAELDKEIKNNRKLVKVLKRYADDNFYDIVEDPLDDGAMILEDSEIDLDLTLKDYDYIPVGCLAKKILKEIGEEE